MVFIGAAGYWYLFTHKYTYSSQKKLETIFLSMYVSKSENAGIKRGI
jgi:hypothetical protein